MGESLLSTIVAGGVILPPDLVPDDHPVIYDEYGNPSSESLNHADLDEELAAEIRNAERYIALAVGYYNQINGTDYVLCDTKGFDCGLSTIYDEELDTLLYHCGFHAAPSSDVSAAKAFYCEFDPKTDKFVSCHMLDGVRYCERCDTPLCEVGEEDYMKWDKGWGNNTVLKTDSGSDKIPSEESRKSDMLYGSDTSSGSDKVPNGLSLNDCRYSGVPPPYLYSGDLSAGVSLSDKAKLRLKMVLPALTYYNNKKHTNYKLVDALPYCESLQFPCDVAHCNFIARQGDGPNKLFFVELEQHEFAWVVVSCVVVLGKTTAGCHQCPVSERARTVIHPTCGFQHGLDLPPWDES